MITGVENKKATVIGLGKSGLASVRLLLAKGASVSVSEAKEDPALIRLANALEQEGALVELGGHTRRWIEGRDLIVTSPGVPPQSLPLRWAGEAKIPILSEIELGFLYCPGRIVAVTGTNGKSTTTALLGEILQKGGKRCFICGNIGTPFCEIVPKMTEEHWAVVEVSSFQLEHCHAFKPRIAMVLNIAPNHLDRHPSFEAYQSAKRRIAQAQSEDDALILNAEDPHARTLGE
ncbi:MAG: Mur ligase family protein, partial [Candidatus Omnitrophota bacterium]